MTYKDKEKQKEANKQAAQRRRDKAKGMTEGMMVTPEVIPILDEVPTNFGQPDCQCRQCCNNRKHGSPLDINHGPRKPASELSHREVNRVSLPGDVDYVGGVARDAVVLGVKERYVTA